MGGGTSTREMVEHTSSCAQDMFPRSPAVLFCLKKRERRCCQQAPRKVLSVQPRSLLRFGGLSKGEERPMPSEQDCTHLWPLSLLPLVPPCVWTTPGLHPILTARFPLERLLAAGAIYPCPLALLPLAPRQAGDTAMGPTIIAFTLLAPHKRRSLASNHRTLNSLHIPSCKLSTQPWYQQHRQRYTGTQPPRSQHMFDTGARESLAWKRDLTRQSSSQIKAVRLRHPRASLVFSELAPVNEPRYSQGCHEAGVLSIVAITLTPTSI